MVWKWRRIETSIEIVIVMLSVLTYVVSFIDCFGIELALCHSYLKRFDLTKCLLFDTFFIAVRYK